MKKGGIFLFILSLVCSVWAQTNMENVFQKNNPNIILQNESQTYKGQPLVFLEGVSDKPQPKTWQDKLKMRLFGSMEIPKKSNEPELDPTPSFSTNSENTVEIRPSFGPKKQVAFLPHTTDWTFIVNQINSNIIDIYENMVFVLTDTNEELVRDWPVSKQNFRLIQSEIDHLPLQLEQNEKSSFIRLPPLNSGVHTLKLNYVINLDQNTFPLIGKNWPLLADRFSGILFSNELESEKLKFLVGTNAKEFPENFKVQKDKKGNIAFQMSKILPPKTQIQLNLPQKELIDDSENNSLIFFWIFMGILLIYIGASCLEIKSMPLEKKFKKFRFYSLNPFFNFCHRSGELAFGSILLFILMAGITYLSKNLLSFPLWVILILAGILCIVFSDYFIFYPIQKQIHQMRYNTQKEKQ